MPSPGDVVLYCLTQADAERANHLRQHGQRIARIPLFKGVQRHVGPEHVAGEACPLLVVEASSTGIVVSGQAFLKGNDSIWVENAPIMTTQGAGCWTVRQGPSSTSPEVCAALPWWWALLRWALCRGRRSPGR